MIAQRSRFTTWCVLGFTACMFLLVIPACKRKDSSADPSRPVVIAVDQNPSSLDPVLVLDIHSHMIASAIHAPLLLTDPDGALRPIIAERVEMASDGLTCVIELRENAAFWDGSPVTPADVVFSFERLQRSAHPHKWILERIAGMEIQGTRSLTIRFTEPDPEFPRYIASGLTAIVKSGSDETAPQPFDSHIIGAGAFKPDRLEPGSRFTLRRNDGFPEPSEISTLEFTVISDSQNQLQAMASGRADVVRLRGSMLGEACERTPDGKLVPKSRFRSGRIISTPANELTFMLWNWESIQADHLNADDRRQWLGMFSHALSREDLVRQLYLGQAVSAEGIVPPSALRTPFSWPMPDSNDISARVGLTLLTPNDPDSRRLASYLQERARAVGLSVQVTSVELGQLVQRLLGGNYELALFWIEQQIPSGPIPWTQFFREDSPFAAIGQPVRGIGDAVTAARSLLDIEKRQGAYTALVDRINEEQAAWLPIVSRNTVLLVSDRIDGEILDSNGVVYWTRLTTRE